MAINSYMGFPLEEHESVSFIGINVANSNSAPSRKSRLVQEQLIHNLTTIRRDLFNFLADPRRDLRDACGHPKGSIPVEMFQETFDRNGVGKRVVEVYPEETWQVVPEIYETEQESVLTPFEEAWNGLAQSMSSEPDHLRSDSDGSVIWEYLSRIDVQSGIGRYGILLLGLNDGRPLFKPVKGVTEKNSKPGMLPEQEGTLDGEKRPIVLNEEDVPIYSLTVNQEETEGRQLIYLRTFPESQVTISSYETNFSSPRYGKPTEYLITETIYEEGDRLEHSGTHNAAMSKRVHWSRVIHIADNLNSSSEVYGSPRMELVIDRLLDLQKLYGGSGEMYWRGAFPGLSFESTTPPGGVEFDVQSLKDMYEDYSNDLQRAFYLLGMTVKSLAPQVVAANEQISAMLEAICIALGVPMRIFMGSERGELASSQDAKAWNRRVKKRQKRHVTPRIIRPFVNRLIYLGVLPVPEKGYQVEWPELASLSELESAEVASQIAEAMGKYITYGLKVIMPPIYFLTTIMGFDVEEVQQWLQEAEKIQEEEERKMEEEAQRQALLAGDPTNDPSHPGGTSLPKPPVPKSAGVKIQKQQGREQTDPRGGSK